jgi:hypothetical protein
VSIFSRKTRWIGIFLLSIGTFGLVVFARPLLTKSTWLIGELGTIDDDVTVLIVAGGDRRFELAADWIETHPKARLALVESPRNRLTENGVRRARHEESRQILLQMGVRESNLLLIPRGELGIDLDHLATVKWATANSADRVGILVECLAVRRYSEQHNGEPGPHPKIQIIGLPTSDFPCDQWHRSTTGVKAYSRELLRWTYWRLFGEGKIGPRWDENQWLKELPSVEKLP